MKKTDESGKRLHGAQKQNIHIAMKSMKKHLEKRDRELICTVSPELHPRMQ